MTVSRTLTERPGRARSWIFEPRPMLLLWSSFMVAAIVTAPFAAAAGRPEGWVLYSAFDPLCHQLPGRSWHVEGMPLAVCVRCFGVYLGILIAAFWGLRLPVTALAMTLGLMAGAWAVEVSGLAAPGAEIRFVTGIALGAALCAVVLSATPER